MKTFLATRVLPACGLALLLHAIAGARLPQQFEPPENYKPETTKLQLLKEKPNGVQIEFAVLPGQWKGAELWSCWGDAVHASDGNFYCSYGDHAGKHGHGFVVKIDPKAKTLDVVVDFNKVTGLTDPKKYAPGKIHGPLVEHGGWLYFGGYRGAEKYAIDQYGYDGDFFLRYHLKTGRVENLGVLVKDCSYPTYRILERDGKPLLYGLATPGNDLGGRDNWPEVLFVYDLEGRKLHFTGGKDYPLNVARAFILAPDGRAFYSTTLPAEPTEKAAHAAKVTAAKAKFKGQQLTKELSAIGPRPKGRSVMVRYDPKNNTLEPLKAVIPGDGVMRGASRTGKNGVAYGVTQDTGEVFAFDTNTETLKPISDVIVWPTEPNAARGHMSTYTTVLKLDPTDRYVYAVPRGHGGAEKVGSPVVRIDVQTGKKDTLCKLLDPVLKETGYMPMGSFGNALSADGKQFLIVWNGCDPKWAKGGAKYSYSEKRDGSPALDFSAVTLLTLP